jgi:hypothetical protein
MSVVGLIIGGFSVALADDQAECKPILEKAIKAMGGEAKLNKFKAGTWKAKTTGKEMRVDVAHITEGTWQGRDQFKVDAEVQERGMSRKAMLVINGETGWITHGGKTGDVRKEMVTFYKNFLFALRLPQLLTQLHEKEFQLSPLRELKIDNVEAVGIKIEHKDYKDARIFFDKKKGLPIKSEIVLTQPPSKELAVEYIYSDYKDFDGVKLPAKILILFDGKEFTIELSEVKSSDKLDDDVFGKP